MANGQWPMTIRPKHQFHPKTKHQQYEILSGQKKCVFIIKKQANKQINKIILKVSAALWTTTGRPRCIMVLHLSFYLYNHGYTVLPRIQILWFPGCPVSFYRWNLCLFWSQVRWATVTRRWDDLNRAVLLRITGCLQVFFCFSERNHLKPKHLYTFRFNI